MILTGLAFLITWLQLAVFYNQPYSLIDVAKAILVTAIIYIIVGIVVGERPWRRDV
jgi:hypothetical protein